MSDAKRYLGDSVYAEFDGYHVVLTTENGYGPSNTIACVFIPEGSHVLAGWDCGNCRQSFYANERSRLQRFRDNETQRSNAVMNTYGFLYFRQRHSNEERYRTFKGRTVNEDARKMARFIAGLRDRFESWDDPEVDYEVDINGTPRQARPRKQEDLYSLGDKHPIHEFLP